MTVTLPRELRLLEADEQDQGDSLIAQMGGDVVRLAQVRPSMIEFGLPDRRYRWRYAFWWEFKSQSAKSKLTADQYAFLSAELDVNELAGCGTLKDLEEFVGALRTSRETAMLTGRLLVMKWAARGLRPSSRPPRGAGR